MKRWLSLFLVTLIVFSLVGCNKETSSPNSKATTKESTSDKETTDTTVDEPLEVSDKEAPQLAEKVAAGELPPLEERLPVSSDIMVEPDVMELGEYGGSLVTPLTDNGRWGRAFYTEQSLFRFKQDESGEVEANICKNFYPNDDSTVWTVELREGMKWSDGTPLLADDFVFYYDHMSHPALNEDRSTMDSEAEGAYSVYTSKAYECFQVSVDGVRLWAEIDKLDDYTVTYTFAAPKPDFPVRVAVDNKWAVLPKHFYKNYVARKDGVTDDSSFPAITEDEALANANTDFGKQWDAYGTMAKDIGYYHWDYHRVPQLRAFIPEKDNWDAVGETYRMVRNPYFWKTDSEGRQLPYLDQIEFQIINEQDQTVLKAMSGEFDQYSPPVSEYSTVATALKDSHRVSVNASASWSSDEAIQLNQTVKDLDKRELFQDKRFREALSLCMDRNLMNETMKNGICEPAQSSVSEGRPGYDKEWSTKWTAYNVERANELLDEITEPWDKAEGTFRKMKGTSKDVEVILSMPEGGSMDEFISLLQSSCRAIGVKLSDKIDPQMRDALLSNDLEATTEYISLATPALRPDSLVPMRNVEAWHSAYGKWYEDGKTEANGGIEPTGDVMELIVAYEAMQNANGPDRDKIIADSVQKIYDLHKENLWVIGFLTPTADRSLVSNALRNVPEGLTSVDEYRYVGHLRPEQFWKADD